MVENYPETSQPSSPLNSPVNRMSIFFFCIVNFLFWGGLYLYVPILPVYITSAGYGLGIVGTVISAYAIPQIILRIPIGIWSDKLGRRKPLVAGGVIFTSLGALGLGLTTSPVLLFLSRMTTGIGAAAWVVFPLYFAAYYPESSSGRAIGLINFVRSLALIGATTGGGFLAENLGLDRTFLLAALLGFCALLALAFTRETPVHITQASSWRGFLSTATRPLLLAVSLMGILLFFATFTGVFGFVPVYGTEIGASAGELGLVIMLNLGFSALGSLSAVWLLERLGCRATIIVSALCISGSLFAIPFITRVPLLMAVQIGCGLGSGVLMTLFMILSIRGLPRENQATAMGIFQAVYAIGMLAGPLISGFLADTSGISAAFYLAASFSLLIAGMALLPVFSGLNR